MNNSFHNDFEHEHGPGAGYREIPFYDQDWINLKSVGIDIGSSTSHLIFSKLVLRRLGVNLSSRFVVVNREFLWKSKILLTPYRDRFHTIDTETLSDFIDSAYLESGFSPEEIDTGAVIITGEAARKDNAEAITALFSKEAGKFVCAVAGHNMEAALSAYGSGGVLQSSSDNGAKLTVMIVDVGGGTCKIAIAQNGAVTETGAINVGSRLISLDESDRIVRLEEAARVVAQDLGMNLETGMPLSLEAKQKIVKRFAELILNLVERKSLSPLARKLMLTAPLNYAGTVDRILFAGGVAEYIYDLEGENFGDLGNLLGSEIRAGMSSLNTAVPIGEATERIRATVIGASQYTIQVSGNTIFISRDDLLPFRNLKVITPVWETEIEDLTPQSVARSIQKAFNRLDLVEGTEPTALALHWPWGPRYLYLKTLAGGIVSGLKETVAKKIPIILIFDNDVGRLVGNLMEREFGVKTDIVSVDMVDLKEFDYIDIGETYKKSGTVPIVIKSLVF